jgi:hypothetical protein
MLIKVSTTTKLPDRLTPGGSLSTISNPRTLLYEMKSDHLADQTSKHRKYKLSSELFTNFALQNLVGSILVSGLSSFSLIQMKN